MFSLETGILARMSHGSGLCHMGRGTVSSSVVDSLRYPKLLDHLGEQTQSLLFRLFQDPLGFGWVAVH